jgi:uncharacterized protein (TIGR00251 family)
MPRPFAAVSDGLRLRVKLTPKARHSAIDGMATEADGSVALKVAVTAVPEKGRANEALIELLAREWRIARSRITLESGATDRRKTLHLAGDPMSLEALLTAWLAHHHGKSERMKS